MKIRRITLLLVVDAIEPLMPHWKKSLGFAAVVEVPEGDVLGFVLLARDDQQVMLQTKASLAKDIPAVAAKNPESLTYMDVDSLDEAQKSMTSTKVLVPRRTTFYGAHEIFYELPSGHVIALAEHSTS